MVTIFASGIGAVGITDIDQYERVLQSVKTIEMTSVNSLNGQIIVKSILCSKRSLMINYWQKN